MSNYIHFIIYIPRNTPWAYNARRGAQVSINCNIIIIIIIIDTMTICSNIYTASAAVP